MTWEFLNVEGLNPQEERLYRAAEALVVKFQIPEDSYKIFLCLKDLINEKVPGLGGQTVFFALGERFRQSRYERAINAPEFSPFIVEDREAVSDLCVTLEEKTNAKKINQLSNIIKSSRPPKFNRESSRFTSRGRPTLYPSEVVLLYMDRIKLIANKETFSYSHRRKSGDRSRTENVEGAMLDGLAAALDWALSTVWQSESANPEDRPGPVNREGILSVLKRRN